MHTQFQKSILLSITATIGIAAINYLWWDFLTHLGVSAPVIFFVCIASFIALWAPVPYQFVSTMRLVRESTHDSLTGILNRNAFNDIFKSILENATKRNQVFHLLLIDLNKFKQINDTLGHNIGDKVLQIAANKLVESIRPGDIVARLGGDEFAVIVLDPDNVKSYTPVIHKIISNLNRTVTIDHNQMFLSGSIGVASFPETEKTTIGLLRCADIAMYCAKHSQKEYSIYNYEDDTFSISTLSLMGELKAAIDDGDCEVWLQPKMKIDTGIVDSVECLIRWNHPLRGILGPDLFMGAAESSGLVKHITQEVVKEAASYYTRLAKLGYDISFSVNVSNLDIIDPNLMTTIIKNIVKADMPPNKLTLEVTETSIMHEPEAAFKVLVALESLGIRLSIDDFGTGYSSLLYLKKFPIHEVKLDKSFIMDVNTNAESHSIVKSTIELAHALKAITVAEGVESAEVETILRELGCDYIQGYVIAKAMPFNEFVEWLDHYQNGKH